MKYTPKLFLAVVAIVVTSVFTSCSKDDDNNSSSAPATSPAITAKSDPQVKCKIDGTSINWVATATNDVYASIGISGPPQSVAYSAAISTDFMFSKNAIDIEKGTTVDADSAAFHNYFAVGTYPYSPGAANGMVISYWDADGIRYSTDEGTSDQTGSTFKILENYYYVVITGEICVNAKVSFNCKVYSASGTMKTITDGSGVFTFEKYY